MTHEETVKCWEKVDARGMDPKLDSILALLHELGDPQNRLRYVHVAGTNGKGSVTAMLSSVCTAAGLRTGRYTSPAVFDEAERYCIDGTYISQKDFDRLFEKVLACEDAVAACGLRLPTRFEIETVIAILYFAEQNCDIVIMECGMGGLLDATNVIPAPEVCVFTSIDMDHMRFLGTTVEEIAEMKAGIIKDGSDVVIEQQRDDVLAVIRHRCEDHHIPSHVTDLQALTIYSDVPGTMRFSYRGIDVTLPLAGRFQFENAACVVDTAAVLEKRGFSVTEDAVRLGLSNVTWHGRLQNIGLDRPFWLDGAHNPNACARLAESLPGILDGKNLILIMGVFADKNHRMNASLLCPLAKTVFTVTPPGPRGFDAAVLAEEASAFCGDVQAMESMEAAVRSALLQQDDASVILVCGSLSHLSSAAQAYRQAKK